MRFPPALLDEIRARLPVSSVVGKRVKLRRQGREYVGLSPFNAEKTPSFFVNDQKGFYHDFSSGKHGDIFRFLMEVEGLGFPEAVERLASEAGVSMPARDPRAEEEEKKRAGLHEVIELAARFFEASLQAKEGAVARGYLARRGIQPDAQRRFRLGYAPSSRAALKEHLTGKGVGHDQMVEAGLLIAGDDIPVSYDRFRDRVIFPITDFRGRIVAFGGRALQADVPAKYLNSPETALFSKGSLLYNGAEARKAAHEAGTIVVVEGYVDVIACVTAGIGHTVAPLGTALTERQLDLLWRMADEPVLCFDGDKAGHRAASRAAELALPHLAPGRSLRFAMLPEGQDPDDLIRASGREAMAGVLAAARPLVEVLWARETEGGVFDTPERRAALETRVRELVRNIAEPTVRRHYQQALDERIAAFFAPVAEARPALSQGRDFNRAGRPFPSRLGPSAGGAIPVSERLLRSGIASRSGYPLREAVLVLTMINHPSLLAGHEDEFAALEFEHAALSSIRDVILGLIADEPGLEAGVLRGRLGSGPQGAALARLDAQIRASGSWTATEAAAPEDAFGGWLQALTLHRRARTLHKELRNAEAALAADPSEVNLARLKDIQNELANGEGTEALIEGFGVPSGRLTRAT